MKTTPRQRAKLRERFLHTSRDPDRTNSVIPDLLDDIDELQGPRPRGLNPPLNFAGMERLLETEAKARGFDEVLALFDRLGPPAFDNVPPMISGLGHGVFGIVERFRKRDEAKSPVDTTGAQVAKENGS